MPAVPNKPMRTITVGTTPVELANAEISRIRWELGYVPGSVIAGNTGNIFVGRGFIPTATLGAPNMGDVMDPGSTIVEEKKYDGDALPYKGPIWAVSDTPGQVITFESLLASEINSGAQ